MNAEKSFVEMFSVHPQICSFVKKFLRLLQNRVQATHLFLEGDDLEWGASGLGDDLGWGGEAASDAQGCGGRVGPHHWDCLRGILGLNTRTSLERVPFVCIVTIALLRLNNKNRGLEKRHDLCI